MQCRAAAIERGASSVSASRQRPRALASSCLGEAGTALKLPALTDDGRFEGHRFKGTKRGWRRVFCGAGSLLTAARLAELLPDCCSILKRRDQFSRYCRY